MSVTIRPLPGPGRTTMSVKCWRHRRDEPDEIDPRATSTLVVEDRTDVGNTDIVRACFESYVRQDRDRAEALIGDPFVFTSPQDDHIDRTAYFERCFPTMDRLRRHELLHVTSTGTEDVFALYEYELATGEVFRNAEVLTVRDGQIVEVQVFFGGRVDG